MKCSEFAELMKKQLATGSQKRVDAISAEFYSVDVASPGPVIEPSTYTYREACLMNGWDPDAPMRVVFNADEWEAK